MEGSFDTFLSWLAMGGYAPFVWPAYGISAAVLGGLAWLSWRGHRLSDEALARPQRREDGRHGPGAR